MLPLHIALVSKTRQIRFSELSKVAAALQKQATRDLGPIWHLHATVDAFEKIRDIPVGYWPIIIKEITGDPSVAGFHSDKHRQPFALVALDEGWPLTCSHEMCEMLVDPFGNRMVSSGSLIKKQGRVHYLVEVCDPSEAENFSYSVNGIQLSDFYTPHYFDPVKASGVRYSFTGALSQPKQIRKGGYLSWLDPETDEWWQASWFGGGKKIENITGQMNGQGGSLRARIDRITHTPRQLRGVSAAYIRKDLSHAKSRNRFGLRNEQHWETEIRRLEKWQHA